jgi:voltage-gated sodium channel
MGIFFYVTAVMATGFFSETHPEWFGHLGLSLYTLFQVMTLESWSMGIVRPLMESHPWAWLFFVPFIVFATFTILNLFIGIIVSTMQEIGPATPTLSSATPDPSSGSAQRSGSDSATNTSSTFTSEALLARIRADLTELERRGLRTDQTSSDLATPDQATPDQAPSIATPQED